MQEEMIKFKRYVDKKIESRIKTNNPLIEALYKSALYSVEGGKRIRAIFTSLIAGLFGVKPEKVLNSACAMELIHASSLILDDMPFMDNSELRRGKPSNHVVFGQDTAMLACIALISEAVSLILDDEELSTVEQNKITGILMDSFGFNGLAAGQFVDLKLKQKNVDYKIFEFINQKKTAALFTASASIAAVIGGADEEQTKAVLKFSEDIGFAFQIIDDMLDVAGNEKVVGKNLGHDKINFVKLVGKDEAQNYIKKYHSSAEQALDVFGSKAETLKKFSAYLIARIM